MDAALEKVNIKMQPKFQLMFQPSFNLGQARTGDCRSFLSFVTPQRYRAQTGTVSQTKHGTKGLFIFQMFYLHHRSNADSVRLCRGQGSGMARWSAVSAVNRYLPT